MELDEFDSIIPSRYVSFTLPSPNIPNLKLFLQTDRLRIAILDSRLHQPTDDPPAVGAILVPRFRETDWIFSTEAGLFQLLSDSPGISRLILIGNDPSECGKRIYTRPLGDDLDSIEKIEGCLYPLLMSFLPKRNQELKRYEIPFLRYEDNVVNSVVLERLVGPVVGEILVEDVVIKSPEKEFRRKMRFKRMPNLVQSEIRIVPMETSFSPMASLSLGDVKFQPDLSALVHIYLAPMAASLSLTSVHLQGCIDSKIKPRALCIGVGGGALVGFLATQLGFEVVGVEVDQVVLSVAMKYFGLEQCESVRVFVGDGIEFLKNYPNGYKFDAIMVDLDPGDFRTDTSVPPLEFMQESVLFAAKSCLSDSGLLVLNVIPLDKLAFENLIHRLKEVFVELYQINVGNEENFVVIATITRIGLSARDHEDEFFTKLRSDGMGLGFDLPAFKFLGVDHKRASVAVSTAAELLGDWRRVYLPVTAEADLHPAVIRHLRHLVYHRSHSHESHLVALASKLMA
ncbi:hypothetical protein V2J09_002559 [Rumex salicifolius]